MEQLHVISPDLRTNRAKLAKGSASRHGPVGPGHCGPPLIQRTQVGIGPRSECDHGCAGVLATPHQSGATRDQRAPVTAGRERRRIRHRPRALLGRAPTAPAGRPRRHRRASRRSVRVARRPRPCETPGTATRSRLVRACSRRRRRTFDACFRCARTSPRWRREPNSARWSTPRRRRRHGTRRAPTPRPAPGRRTVGFARADEHPRGGEDRDQCDSEGTPDSPRVCYRERDRGRSRGDRPGGGRTQRSLSRPLAPGAVDARNVIVVGHRVDAGPAFPATDKGPLIRRDGSSFIAHILIQLVATPQCVIWSGRASHPPGRLRHRAPRGRDRGRRRAPPTRTGRRLRVPRAPSGRWLVHGRHRRPGRRSSRGLPVSRSVVVA